MQIWDELWAFGQLWGPVGARGAWVVKQLRELSATPVVFDIAENRERLHLIMPDADSADCSSTRM